MSNDIPAQFRAVLDELGLKPYGAAQIIAAETDEELRVIHTRISRRLRGTDHLRKLEGDLAALGYKVQIVKREENL